MKLQRINVILYTEHFWNICLRTMIRTAVLFEDLKNAEQQINPTKLLQIDQHSYITPLHLPFH